MILEISDYGKFNSMENIDMFLRECCKNMNVKYKLLFSKTHKKAIVRKRHMIAFVMHKKAGMNYKDLAIVLKARSEGTIRHACNKCSFFLGVGYADTKAIHEVVHTSYENIVGWNDDSFLDQYNNIPQF